MVEYSFHVLIVIWLSCVLIACKEKFGVGQFSLSVWLQLLLAPPIIIWSQMMLDLFGIVCLWVSSFIHLFIFIATWHRRQKYHYMVWVFFIQEKRNIRFNSLDLFCKYSFIPYRYIMTFISVVWREINKYGEDGTTTTAILTYWKMLSSYRMFLSSNIVTSVYDWQLLF